MAKMSNYVHVVITLYTYPKGCPEKAIQDQMLVSSFRETADKYASKMDSYDHKFDWHSQFVRYADYVVNMPMYVLDGKSMAEVAKDEKDHG